MWFVQPCISYMSRVLICNPFSLLSDRAIPSVSQSFSRDVRSFLPYAIEKLYKTKVQFLIVLLFSFISNLSFLRFLFYLFYLSIFCFLLSSLFFLFSFLALLLSYRSSAFSFLTSFYLPSLLLFSRYLLFSLSFLPMSLLVSRFVIFFFFFYFFFFFRLSSYHMIVQ